MNTIIKKKWKECMNLNYFNDNENTDFKLLEEFNEKTRYFNDIERCREKNVIDAIATRGENIFNIELKMRYVDINKYNSIFIEPNKVAVLLLEYQLYGKIPLYINFFQDINCVAIWNLSKITSFGYNPSVTINDKGYEKNKKESRILLYTRDACINIKNNNDENYRLIKPSYLQ